MLVPGSPRRIVATTSSSAGSEPDGVERNLYTPTVKSRGRGVEKTGGRAVAAPGAPVAHRALPLVDLRSGVHLGRHQCQEPEQQRRADHRRRWRSSTTAR